ncbi:MAG: hypothetical protein LBU65_07720 [Planctomycetaceae bacterium]|jgi:hypothetical protein|nr:hypothetical protein [Planctomycetaceae bacterium]
MIRIIFIIVCPLFIISPVFAAQDEIAAIEKKCIANRLAIKKYHIKVKIEREFFDEADQSNVRCTGLQFYYDDQNRRCDTTYEWYNPKLTSDTGRYVQMVVWNETDKFQYRWFDGIDEEGRKSAFQAYSIDDKVDRESSMMEFSDFRILGFSTSGFLFKVPIDDIVGSPAKKNIGMEDVVLNGLNCKKISTEYIKTGASVCYWIVPEKGYSIVRIEGKTKEGAVEWTELDVEKDAASGLWFPMASRMEQWNNDKLVWSEKLKIDVISLNQKIDLAYFTPQTMNVRVGAAVIMPPISNEKFLFWNGENIVDENGTVYPYIFKGEDGRQKRLIVCSVLSAVIGLILLRQYFREKKRTNN